MRQSVLVSLLGLLIITQSVRSSTFRVPEDAPTIQAGLDSLQDGDTVLVALGIYAEALMAPPLHFVLRGNVIPDTGDYARPVIDPSALPGSDTLTCLILPEDSHPVLEDLLFHNGPQMYPRSTGIGGIQSWASDPVLHQVVFDSVYRAFWQERRDSTVTIIADTCTFRNVTPDGCGLGGFCAVLATDCFFSGHSNLLAADSRSHLKRCHFETGNYPVGYMLGVGGSDVRVESCVFGPAPQLAGPAMSVSSSGGVVLVGNLFVNCVGGYGQVLDVSATAVNSMRLTDNAFVALHSTPPFQGVGGISIAWSFGYGPGHIAALTENEFLDCSGLFANVLSLRSGAELTKNRFFNLDGTGAPAIRTWDTDEADSSIVLRDNLFSETGRALENGDPFLIDARWNWWGDSTGPYHASDNPGGQGDTITGNVAFTPWYADTSFLESVPDLGTPLPASFQLTAYPNPFNSTVTLKLIPPDVMIVRVELFDILGRRIKELWSGPLAYEKTITFDGSSLASGIYFVRVWQPIGNRPLALQKLVLLK